MPSIFLTGATGCVGHYLVDEFSPEYHLYLLVRNPARLKFDPATRPNITIVQGDLDHIADQAGLLSQMDYCIHAATAWGAEGTYRINTQRTHELFNLLNPNRVKRIIYFSTAGILGKGNRPLPEAEKYGTEYIRSKYHSYITLPECRLYDRIVTVFPTLVFGGDDTHPVSFLSSGLPFLRRYAWLIGRLNVETRFHFIHAEDIARIVHYLLEAPRVEKDYVLGNDPVSLGEFTRRAAAYFGHRVRWQITVSPKTLLRLGRFFGAEIPRWDQFCVEYNHFVYDTVNCHTFGLPTTHSTVEEIVADWAIIQRQEGREGTLKL